MCWFKPCAGQEIIATSSNGVTMRWVAWRAIELSKKHRTGQLCLKIHHCSVVQRLCDFVYVWPCSFLWFLLVFLYFCSFHYPHRGYLSNFPIQIPPRDSLHGLPGSTFCSWKLSWAFLAYNQVDLRPRGLGLIPSPESSSQSRNIGIFAVITTLSYKFQEQVCI